MSRFMKLQPNHLRVYIFFTIVTRKSNFLNSIRLDYFLNSISEVIGTVMKMLSLTPY